jgi:hypothetical protein
LSAGLAVLILVSGGIFWVQNRALGETLQQAKQKEAEVEDGQARERRRELALGSLEKDRAQIRFLETAVTDSAYVPTLLKQLEEVAVQTHNRVLGVQPQLVAQAPTKLDQRRDPEAQAKGEGEGGEKKKKEPAPEPYTRLSIQVNLVGGFQSTQAFVERLTKFPKIVAVEQMQVRPHQVETGAKTDDSLLDVEVNLTAYVMKDPAAKPAVTASAAVGGTN